MVAGGQRGQNIIREMGGGIDVCVRRALAAEPEPLPPMGVAVHVAQLRASLLDSEYALILAALAGNFGESPAPPRGAAWLHARLLAGQSGDRTTLAAGLAGDSDSTQRATSCGDKDTGVERAVLQDAVRNFGATSSALLGLLGDSPALRSTVSIDVAQLALWNEQPGGLPPAPVGSVELGDLWVAVTLTAAGNMLLSLRLPTVCARDLRPGVPEEVSLVLSTADMGAVATAAARQQGAATWGTSDAGEGVGKVAAQETAGGPLLPSLLSLDLRSVRSAGPEPLSALSLRLQRPTLVLDVGFLLRLLHFVAPGAGLEGPVPRAFHSRELLLCDTPHIAQGHLWLSPEYRLLADSPGWTGEAVYDGAGHALVLPDCVPGIEHVPLIVVGRGRTLRLRNVRLVNADVLPGVLSLAPGAQLLIESSDGVSLHGKDELARLRDSCGRCGC